MGLAIWRVMGLVWRQDGCQIRSISLLLLAIGHLSKVLQHEYMTMTQTCADFLGDLQDSYDHLYESHQVNAKFKAKKAKIVIS